MSRCWSVKAARASTRDMPGEAMIFEAWLPAGSEAPRLLAAPASLGLCPALSPADEEVAWVVGSEEDGW
eukprot:153978-Hanusia_phi.AAC.1